MEEILKSFPVNTWKDVVTSGWSLLRTDETPLPLSFNCLKVSDQRTRLTIAVKENTWALFEAKGWKSDKSINQPEHFGQN